MTFPILALLTDFGDRDGFVGAMKGTIYSRIQSADTLTSQSALPPIVDISHHITPQNLDEAAWVLFSTYRSFPPNTVFVCVVDPKVGESSQSPILLHWPERNQYFIAPDNGLLTPILAEAGDKATVYRIENEDLFCKDANGQISHTFHGRDVYAPVGAHLVKALGRYMAEEFLLQLGEKLDPQTLECIDWTGPTREKGFIQGRIMHADTFGNLITNIPNHWLASDDVLEILVDEHSWKTRVFNSYAAGEHEEAPFVVPSSSGHLEITFFGASAQQRLGVDAGEALSFRVEARVGAH